MASITMASFIAAVPAADRPSVGRRSLVVAKAASPSDASCCAAQEKKEVSDRRAAMVAAAAAAVCAVSGARAMAGEEPKPGTPEAKKLYAPVCVTMPTARICHK